jgi:hypothetical protein
MTGLVEREIRHAHLYCGLGGGAKGFWTWPEKLEAA